VSQAHSFAVADRESPLRHPFVCRASRWVQSAGRPALPAPADGLPSAALLGLLQTQKLVDQLLDRMEGLASQPGRGVVIGCPDRRGELVRAALQGAGLPYKGGRDFAEIASGGIVDAHALIVWGRS
jgi:hypothetical protein